MSGKNNPLSWVGNALGTILGGGEKAPAPPPQVVVAPPPPAPEPAKPATMPTADDDAVRKARQASIVKQRARQGRQSTILTSEGDTLG